jgi:hypothetical protein
MFAFDYPGENRSVNSWNFPWNSMENFYGKNPSNVYVEFHGIPRYFMKQRLMEFHRIQWNSIENSMEHGIPWNSMNSRNLMEFGFDRVASSLS